MKIYKGYANRTNAEDERLVLITDDKNPKYGKELPLRFDLRQHSFGFAWGYGGSGPAQLSLALLADCMGEEIAQEWYQDFKREYVCGLDMDKDWTLTESEIRAILDYVQRGYELQEAA